MDRELLCMDPSGCDALATEIEYQPGHYHDTVLCGEHAQGKVTSPLYTSEAARHEAEAAHRASLAPPEIDDDPDGDLNRAEAHDKERRRQGFDD